MENKGHKEMFTWDKALSGKSLFNGNRPYEFTHFFKEYPTIERFQQIEQERELDIQGVIFDIDGTLVPPYADIPDPVMETLKAYKAAWKIVAVYTNSWYSERLEKLKENWIIVIDTSHRKPSREWFLDACEQMNVEPDHMAMIGNFATTDMPLSEEKHADPEDRLFPLNILVQSIPIEWKNIEKTPLAVFKVLRNQWLNLFSGWFVKIRNPDIVEEIDNYSLLVSKIINLAKKEKN